MAERVLASRLAYSSSVKFNRASFGMLVLEVSTCFIFQAELIGEGSDGGILNPSSGFVASWTGNVHTEFVQSSSQGDRHRHFCKA